MPTFGPPLARHRQAQWGLGLYKDQKLHLCHVAIDKYCHKFASSSEWFLKIFARNFAKKKCTFLRTEDGTRKTEHGPSGFFLPVLKKTWPSAGKNINK